jgi:DNA primase
VTDPQGRYPDAFLDQVRQRTSLVELIGREIRLTRSGAECIGLCPFHNEKTPSFTVSDRKGFFHCFGCGAHGDALTWAMRYEHMEFREAVEWLAQAAGVVSPAPGQPIRPPKPPVDRPSAAALAEEEQSKIDRARRLWREARPGAGSLVEAWLGARGILVDRLGGVSPSLRFNPAAPYWVRRKLGRWEILCECPAMVAGIQGRDGRVSAVHLTYLSADGRAKAALPPHPDGGVKLPRRKVMGVKAGGSIRFAPPAPRLVLGEGVETVLTARYVRPDLAAWSAVDLGNLVGGGLRQGAPEPHPDRPGATLPAREPDMDRPGLVLPPDVREVLLLGESTNGDHAAYRCLLERGCRRLVRLGLRVRVGMPPCGDLNDWLMQSLGRAT